MFHNPNSNSAKCVFLNQNLHQSLQLANQIFDNLTEGPNPNLHNDDILRMADIVKALYSLKNKTSFSANSFKLECDNENQIKSFLVNFRAHIITVINKLILAQDDSMIEDINMSLIDSLIQFTKLLYSDPINEKELAKTDKLADIIIAVYKAKNGELALRFPNQKQRDEFFAKTGQSQIDPKFTKDTQGNYLPQFKENHSGKTPVKYKNKESLYFSSYQARNGEFAVNFGTTVIRDAFIKLLGFKVTGKVEGEQVKRFYNDDFFTTFDSTLLYKGRAQDTAIYFAADNAIFTQPGSYLKINVTKKTFEHGKVDLDLFASKQEEARCAV